MAECTITDIDIIPNDSPTSGASNPWECHFYTHQTLFVITDMFAEHISWEISGDIPEGISIDSATGVISGNVKPYNEQPSCQDNHPKEKIHISGDNWKKIGRFKHPFYDFHMEVKRTYLIYTDDTMLITAEEVATSNITIRVIRNHDIDNYIYAKEYLEATSSEVPVSGVPRDVMHTLDIDGKAYDKDMFEEFIADHPGPFSSCGQ